MKSILVAVSAALLWLTFAMPAAAQTAPACQFVLGFQTLHDLAPADIGDCVDNQAFAYNGDAQQHTTKGLMAWRKADNWTAFTNGYMTWINGPVGLVSRLNTDRFPWEHDTAAPSTIRVGNVQPALPFCFDGICLTSATLAQGHLIGTLVGVSCCSATGGYTLPLSSPSGRIIASWTSAAAAFRLAGYDAGGSLLG